MSTSQARIPGTRGEGTIPRKPFSGRRQLCMMVDVRFDTSVHAHPFDVGELIVRRGDKLVVQTDKGLQLGYAAGLPERRVIDLDQVRRVVRKANEQDLRDAAELHQLSRRAMKSALARIRQQNLAMKLVEVEYMLDRSRALFYFTSEKRVDFRNLVRELARELNIRIEMRQIGVRDGAGVIGGIGPCGQELCCSTFLRSFHSVSIRHAKDQGLTLNPQRVTGMCGRLKCCLVYEHDTYRELRRFAPRRDRSVMTSQGPGSILEVDALNRKLLVRFPGGSIESIHLRDAIVLDVRLTQEELQATMSREEEILSRRRQKSSGAKVATRESLEVLNEEYMWAEVEQDVSFFTIEETTDDGKERSDGNKKSRSSRRRRSRRKKPNTQGGSEQNKSTNKEAKSAGGSPSEGAPKPKRKRRSRKRKPSNQEQNTQNSPQQKSAGGAPKSEAATKASGGADESASKPRRKRRSRRRKPRNASNSGSGKGGDNSGQGNAGGGSSGSGQGE